MSAVNEIFSCIKNEGAKLVKEEFTTFINEGLSEKDEQIKRNAEKVQEWCISLSTGQLKRTEFEALLSAQRRKMHQYINTKEIQSRARAEKIALGLIDLALRKILPLVVPV